MKILLGILGGLLVVGTGGYAYYYFFAVREVARGNLRGFSFRIMKQPGEDKFCAMIRDQRENPGFAVGSDFQILGCHPTISQAKGEALEAIINIREAESDAIDEGLLDESALDVDLDMSPLPLIPAQRAGPLITAQPGYQVARFVPLQGG